MRTAKYLFEFEEGLFNFIFIFLHTVSFCTIISVVAQIGIGTISLRVFQIALRDGGN